MFGFKENKEPWRGGVYLTTVDSTMTADILISKLAAEGIPCMKRHEGASNFLELYMGMSTVFPVELYVPEESLKLAEEIIRPVPIEDDYDEISEEELAALAEAGDLEAAEAALRNEERSELPETGAAETEMNSELPADDDTEEAKADPGLSEIGGEETEAGSEPSAVEEEPEEQAQTIPDDMDPKRFILNGGVFIDDEDRECR